MLPRYLFVWDRQDRGVKLSSPVLAAGTYGSRARIAGMEDVITGLPAIGLYRRAHAPFGCPDIGHIATAVTSSSKATGASRVGLGPALQRYVATAAGAAFEVVDELSVGSQAIPRMLAPEGPI